MFLLLMIYLHSDFDVLQNSLVVVLFSHSPCVHAKKLAIPYLICFLTQHLLYTFKPSILYEFIERIHYIKIRPNEQSEVLVK